MRLCLILLRHAEAEDAVTQTGDHARRLTARGEAQAASTAGQIAAGGYQPSLCLVSDAARTLGTWQHAKPLLVPVGTSGATVETRQRPQIYSGGRMAILELISEVDAILCDCVILIGHNPTISELASELSGEQQRLAKADALVLEIKAEAWSEATWQSGEWRIKEHIHAAKSR